MCVPYNMNIQLKKIHNIYTPRPVFKARSRRQKNEVVCAAIPYSVYPSLIGVIASFTSTYPLDTYKTRVQVFKISKPKTCSLFHGYPAGLLLCFTTSFIYFNTFQILLQHFNLTHASMIASFISTIAKVPGKSVTKLLQNGSFDSCHDAIQHIRTKFGFKGFYRGFWFYVLDDVPKTVLRYYLYALFGNIFPNDATLVGLCTGLISSVLTQPFDVLQSCFACNMTKKKVDYKQINYFSGLLVALIINSIQATVFYRVYHIFKPLMI